MKICADVGGSFVDIAIVGEDASIHHRSAFPTPTTDWDAFVEIFRAFAARHADILPPGAPVCAAIAGLPDPDTGKVISANIECLHGRHLEQDLAAALGRAVHLINDANAFVLAEARLGLARGHERVFGLILGTGVGGGVVEAGQVMVGPAGIGGEWGHGSIVVASPRDPSAQPVFTCGCGRSGCLDTIGSARGIERLNHFLHGDTRTSHEITAGLAAGDPACVATAEYFCSLLAGPLSMVLNTFPATIVPVGGGLSNSAELIAMLDVRVRTGMLRTVDEPLLRPTILRGNAGLLGASLLVSGPV